MLETTSLVSQSTSLADAIPKVVEFRPPGIAVPDNIYRADTGRMQWEDTLHTLVRDNPSDGDHGVDSASPDTDQDALEDLDPFLFTLDDPDMDIDGVTYREGVGLRRILGLELIGNDDFSGFVLVHVHIP